METLKVLIFNWRDITHPWAGGAEVHIHEVAKRWVKWGHEVTLVSGKFKGCSEEDEVDGINVIRVGNQYSVYPCAFWRFITKLRKSFDVAIDDINGVPFFLPLAQPIVNIPIVAIMHHLVKNMFFKELPFDKAVIGYVAERTIPLVYHSTPFVAVSEGTKEGLVKFGVPKENITVVYNGIDHELYKPNPGRKSPYPHVVYVGRIKRYKNLVHLVKAMKTVISKLSLDNSIKLAIAGKGDCKELKVLASELGIKSYVEFLGEVSEREKIELLQSAWVYVTPSTREGWGLTVLESMACGTPAIGYNVPGIRDAIRTGETGFFVPYGDINSLAETMVRVLVDGGLRRKLAKNAYEWSLNFNWDDCAQQLMELCKGSIYS